jgi:hypothetical protein
LTILEKPNIQKPEAPHPSHKETPTVHANGGLFLTPLQEIEASDWNLSMGEDHTMTKLINICDDAGCPKYLLDKILSTIQKATVNGHFDGTRPCKRETFIKYLHAKFKVSPPKAILVPPLPNASLQNIYVMRDGHRYAMVFVFPFRKQLEDLLSDFTVFGDVSKLCVNVNDTMEELFHKFSAGPGNIYKEVMGAEWYQRTYKLLVTDPETEIVLPIIWYADKTGTDHAMCCCYPLEPWVFTIGLT